MRKILNIVYIAVLIPFLTGCFEERGTEILITDKVEGFVEIVEANGGESATKNIIVIPDGEDQISSITLSYGGAESTSPTEITYEIVEEESTAIEGVDFTMISGSTVTIPAGEYIVPVEFDVVDDILDPENPLTLTFRITSSSANILEEYQEVTITLQGLCPPSLYDYSTIAGSYSTEAVGTSTDPCPGPDPYTFSSTETLTRDEANDIGSELAFTISDSFAGLYEAWYGTCYAGALSSQTGSIFIDTTTGAIRGSGDEVYGTQWEITGLLDACNGNISYTVSNGYADTGTVSLIKN